MKNKLVSFFVGVLFFISASAQVDTSAMQKDYYTSFDGIKIYYEVTGNGFPVILLHGFIANGESWKRSSVYTELINAGYKVITLDMRGNGKSDKPHDSTSYANDAEAKDIMGLATQLKFDKYNVVGYSRGSIITARLLVQDKRISKAVMGGMGTDFTNPEWPRRKMFYRALSGDSVPELQAMVNYVKSTPTLDQTALAYLQKEQPSTSIASLKKVSIPMLIICGDKDADNGSGQALAAVFSNAKFIQVPGDHGAAMNTKEFADAVLSFFK